MRINFILNGEQYALTNSPQVPPVGALLCLRDDQYFTVESVLWTINPFGHFIVDIEIKETKKP